MALGVLAKTTDPAISRVFHDLDDRGNVLAHYTTTPLKGIASPWWALSDLNGRPFGCKPNALTAELSALTQFIVQEAARSVNAQANALYVLGNGFSRVAFVSELDPGIPCDPRRFRIIAAS